MSNKSNATIATMGIDSDSTSLALINAAQLCCGRNGHAGRSNVGKETLGDIACSTADLDPAEIDFSNAIRTRL
jgi:hypothetical protein